MYENGKIYMGLADGARVELALNMCNRHGLIAGASGTGKTITMKVMAESFSDAGVPVFLCDVKGDVAGICAPGVSSEGMEKRIDRFGLRGSFAYKGYPTTFWDIYQTGGHAVRATVSDMGPELLSRILSLTPAQEGILHIVFRIADDKGLLLLDLKDLRAMLNYVSEHRAEYMMTYGNITPQSVAAILRALLPLEQQGGDLFFGEPPLDIHDWMRTDADGRGMVNVLDCVKLVQNPTLYASFLLWMLSELFESLPEAGDLEKPKLVFFFDEAHTLFRDAPAVLVQKIEQTVKLIRSKGVGVFFVTQSQSDFRLFAQRVADSRLQVFDGGLRDNPVVDEHEQGRTRGIEIVLEASLRVIHDRQSGAGGAVRRDGRKREQRLVRLLRQHFARVARFAAADRQNHVGFLHGGVLFEHFDVFVSRIAAKPHFARDGYAVGFQRFDNFVRRLFHGGFAADDDRRFAVFLQNRPRFAIHVFADHVIGQGDCRTFHFQASFLLNFADYTALRPKVNRRVPRLLFAFDFSRFSRYKRRGFQRRSRSVENAETRAFFKRL